MRQLELSYEDGRRRIPVLAEIDLEVREREIVCLVGASGCGKSTLLNLVAGFLTPTAGKLEVNGRPPRTPGTDRVMVFQDDAVFPWYTVRQNVEYGLRMAAVDRARRAERVVQLLEMVGLERFGDTYPRDLSGGMRKRCDLARALALDPQILLMDEPFAALDVMTKEHLQAEFLRLWETNRVTVLFVTHDLEEALLLGDRVAVLRRGPGALRALVDVPFTRPREVALKIRPEFQRLRADLAQAIGETSETGGVAHG